MFVVIQGTTDTQGENISIEPKVVEQKMNSFQGRNLISKYQSYVFYYLP